jgi:hypothetical protein
MIGDDRHNVCLIRDMRHIRPCLIAIVIGLLVPMCAVGCAPSSDSTASAQQEAVGVPADLEDGTYACDATNSTRGNGPYSLRCEKTGDTIVLHFNNGGHVTLDVDSQDKADGHSRQIEASNSENGDSWEITIEE